MSRENVEAVLRGYEQFNRGAFDQSLEAFDPEIEWIVPEVLPDAQIYRGREGVARFWIEWGESFESFRIEIEETIDAGNSVIVMARVSGRGRDSGAEVDTPSFPHIWTFRDGKAVRVEMLPNRAAALETLDLPPDTPGQPPS